jgi:predicted nicotinamide N-methyase
VTELNKRPGLIETPAEALGPTVREGIRIAGRTFTIARPDAVDRLSDHPELGGRSAAEEYHPYWASIWPAARLLAEAVLNEPALGYPRALEIGCGLGLPGLAALARGIHVTFSDYDAAALRFASDNARHNGFTDFDTLHMDWRQPPANLRVPLLLASEPIYVLELVPHLADFVVNVLEAGGLLLLADQERMQAESLRQELVKRGMSCRVERRSVEGVTGIVSWIQARG